MRKLDERASQRGVSSNSPGSFATKMEIETFSDQFPEYNVVDSEIA